jgi:MGT family glycosyltransferase
VTLSTLPQAGELAIARTAIRALAPEAVRILVTLAPGHARAELGAVPDNVYLSDYVPHGTVLPHSRLVISHAGHGIVMKALYHGVPMVLVPWGRDQLGVAARAEALGVATVVRRDDCDDASVAQAVHRILDDPHYTERVRTVARRLQAEDAVTAACTHVESLVTSTA